MASCARVRRRRHARARVPGALVAVLAAACAVVLGGPHAPSALGATGAPEVRLAHLTAVVLRPGGTLSVAVTRTGPAAASGATLQLTLYSRLTTRSGLEAAIGAPGPVGAVSTTGALPASCVAAGGLLAVHVPLAPDGTSVRRGTLCGRAAPVLRLGCAIGCDGVYPLRLTVRGPDGAVSLDTLVTFAPTTARVPLRVAWVLRLSGASGSLASARGALVGVARHPGVPATLDVQGQAIATASPTPASVATLSLLGQLAARRADELMAEAYVPADLGALRASGLMSEVRDQLARTDDELLLAGVRTPPSATATLGTGPQTPTSADALAAIGYHDLVVPGSALATDPTSTLRWGGAFRLGAAPAGPEALATDTDLSALSDDAAADPALSAADVLGELAFLHYEAPDLPQPRAVVVLTDLTSEVPGAFVDQVLAGLARNPVLDPVTVGAAFAEVPLAANGFPGVEDLTLGPSTGYDAHTIGTVRHLRLTVDALASAVRAGASPIPSIDGELLSAEQPLSASQRDAILGSVQSRLADQLGYFRIYDGPITLTQSGAELPFTIYSTAPYTFAGQLQLTSPKLSFPQGSIVRLSGPVGAFTTLRVPANALVNGDIPLTAVLLSPQGHLVMTKAQITVQATQTSIVGIALTALALVVLAWWWVRTSRRRRRAAHH